MRRIFGGNLSEKQSQNWPGLQSEWAKFETSERPESTKKTRKVREMNWLEKKITGPNVNAVTLPWRSILLNRQNIERSGGNLGDTLAHELTHVDQLQKQGLLGTIADSLKQQYGPLLKGQNPNTYEKYLARPKEQEAFESEVNRPIIRSDIRLKPEKKKIIDAASWSHPLFKMR